MSLMLLTHIFVLLRTIHKMHHWLVQRWRRYWGFWTGFLWVIYL